MNDLAFYPEDDEVGIAHPEDPSCDPDVCGGTKISHPDDPSCDPDL